MAMNVMLAVHEKKTNAVDLYLHLRQYITLTYGEREAQSVQDDLVSVSQLRSDLFDRHPPDPSTLDLRRDLLLSYARALAAIEPRFPISPNGNRPHVNSLSFTWFDAFNRSKKAMAQSIHLEKAGVLFNLAAIYSQIALAAERSTAAGLKQACNNFQNAAGAFRFLKDHIATKATAAGATVDTSFECARMLEKLMLAQAQECFFEKVIEDAQTPWTLLQSCSPGTNWWLQISTNVCQLLEVGLYYEEAYVALSATPLNQHFDHTWISHLQLKAAQFFAESCYRCPLELHEKEEIAEEITRLKIGLGALNDAKKSSKVIANVFSIPSENWRAI